MQICISHFVFVIYKKLLKTLYNNMMRIYLPSFRNIRAARARICHRPFGRKT